jgi:hypothetical protein
MGRKCVRTSDSVIIGGFPLVRENFDPAGIGLNWTKSDKRLWGSSDLIGIPDEKSSANSD